VRAGRRDSIAPGIENRNPITVIVLVMKYKLVSVIAMSAGRHAKRSVSVFAGQPIARFDPFVVFVGGRNRCSLPTYSAVTITSAAEARKVALLCGHHLDRLRVLAMASVVRLNGGPIDRILEGLMVCRGFG